MLTQKSNPHILQRKKVHKVSNKKKKAASDGIFKTFLQSWLTFFVHCTIGGLHDIQQTKVHKISNKKKKVASDGIFNTYLKSWLTFFDHCTIDGLHLIAGYSSRLSIKNRITVLLYFLVICGMMVLLCQKNMQTYLLLKPTTTTMYNFRNNLTFPTVSLRNQNRLQRSYVGGNDKLISVLTLAIVLFMDNYLSHYSYFNDLNRKTCATNSTLGQNLNLTEASMNDKVIKMNSSLSVIQCWWQKGEIKNCSNEFSHWNNMIDGISFNAQIDDTSNMKEGFTPITANSSGPYSGLRTLLNVRQDEYCGVDTVPYGAGFKLMLYNPSYRQPSPLLSPSISLQPGYSHEISIQPVTTDRRQLESFGYCRSSFTNQLATDVAYYREACFRTCMIDKLYVECECIYPFGHSMQAISDYVNKPLSELKLCFDSLNGITCGIEQLNMYLRKNPNFFCLECKSPCLETLYSYQLTSTKLTPRKVNRLLNFARNATDEEIMKNNLLVNIYFGDLSEITLIDSLEFTIDELFISLSNHVGLFIGISTLSLFEIIYQIIYSFLISFLKNYSLCPKILYLLLYFTLLLSASVY